MFAVFFFSFSEYPLESHPLTSHFRYVMIFTQVIITRKGKRWNSITSVFIIWKADYNAVNINHSIYIAKESEGKVNVESILVEASSRLALFPLSRAILWVPRELLVLCKAQKCWDMI